MRCSPTAPCPVDQYCDAHVFKCAPCDIICHQGPENPQEQDCRENCPDVWKQISKELTGTALPGPMQHTTPGVPRSYMYIGKIMLPIFIILFFVMSILIVLAAVKIRKKKKSAKHNSPDSRCAEIHAKIPLNGDNNGSAQIRHAYHHSGEEEGSNVKNDHTICDKNPVLPVIMNEDNNEACYSLRGDPISQPSDLDQSSQNHFILPDNETTEKDACYSMVGEETSPKVSHYSLSRQDEWSQDQLGMDCVGVTLNSEPPNNAADGRDYSAQINRDSAHPPNSSSNTNEHLASDICNLQLESVMSGQMPPPGSPHPTQTSTDRTEPFHHVMRAYDAFDARAHELSFARGCLIANDEFRVFTRISRDPGECYDRVKNIMPSDLRDDIIVVEPETPRL